MSAVAQLLKKPFKIPWSPPATEKYEGKCDSMISRVALYGTFKNNSS